MVSLPGAVLAKVILHLLACSRWTYGSSVMSFTYICRIWFWGSFIIICCSVESALALLLSSKLISNLSFLVKLSAVQCKKDGFWVVICYFWLVSRHINICTRCLFCKLVVGLSMYTGSPVQSRVPSSTSWLYWSGSICLSLCSLNFDSMADVVQDASRSLGVY